MENSGAFPGNTDWWLPSGLCVQQHYYTLLDLSSYPLPLHTLHYLATLLACCTCHNAPGLVLPPFQRDS